MILLCKLLLAPGFVVAVTLAVRRFGPRVGGILGGLPVVAGPILLIYSLDHGKAFAAHAAGNSLAALMALTAFVLAVVFASTRTGAWGSVLAGWLAFGVVAAIVGAIDIPPVVGLALSCLTFAAALRVMPHADPNAVASAPQRPPFDLAVRAISAGSLVLVLTSVAGQLGPGASGVLAPFPTITSVLAGFAVAHETRATVLHLVRGMLRGFFSFAAALFLLAVTLEPFGIALAFVCAIAATSVVQLVLLIAVTQARRAPARVQGATSSAA